MRDRGSTPFDNRDWGEVVARYPRKGQGPRNSSPSVATRRRAAAAAPGRFLTGVRVGLMGVHGVRRGGGVASAVHLRKLVDSPAHAIERDALRLPGGCEVFGTDLADGILPVVQHWRR